MNKILCSHKQFHLNFQQWLTALLFCALLPMGKAWGQITLTVYDGTTTNNHVPMYVFYFDDWTRSQVIIPAEDLQDMVGGMISSISFYTTSSNIPYTTVASFDMYLKEVDYTEISAYEDESNMTSIFSGTKDFVADGSGGIITFDISPAFTYNGGNLLIACKNTTDDGYKNIYFYGQTVEKSSISASDASSTSNVAATQQNFIPKTTFTYIIPPTITQSTVPQCGGSAIFTASNGGVELPSGSSYHWYSDEACGTEITTGVSGPQNNTLECVVNSGDRIYCRIEHETATMTQTTKFLYTGSVETYTVPKGTSSLKLEVWGAQGGSSRKDGDVGAAGGKGGYSYGTLNNPTAGTKLYVAVGSHGTNAVVERDSPGGYNGGGKGTWDNHDNESSGAGGGATHIALAPGLLTSFESNYTTKLLLVAGGGGGACWDKSGGAGGGTSPGDGNGGGTIIYGTFGQGANASGVGDGDGVAGGGGGFRGGNAYNISGAVSYAGGGSGYVNTSLLTNTSTSNGVRAGNGSALITATVKYASPVAGVAATCIPYVPTPTVTQNDIPHCGSGTVTFTASSDNVPAGSTYHWYTDADCTNEITTGVSGTNNCNLSYSGRTDVTLYCRLERVAEFVTEIPYTGNIVSYKVPAGATSLKLEVWGAEGGKSYSNEGDVISNGGKGGYSIGYLGNPDVSSTLYVAVGGKGSNADIVSYNGVHVSAQGGFNGGGGGTCDSEDASSAGREGAGGGGGATHIALSSGLMTTFSSNYSSQLLLVAGGGGGASYKQAGGYGGGNSGGQGANGGGFGGTNQAQTSSGTQIAGTFGQGAQANKSNGNGDGNGVGGGGGGFYGGNINTGTSSNPNAGGGGSGYVNTSLLISSPNTIAGDQSFPSVNGGNEIGHSGNGYARITATAPIYGEVASVAIQCTTPPPATIPYEHDFENATENGNWKLTSGTADGWCVGSATYSSSSKSLYISPDNGATNTYGGANHHIYAYRELVFETTGHHAVSYKWKCQGESTCDYMRVFLVPESINPTLTSGTTNSISTSGAPSSWVAVDGNTKLNLDGSNWTEVNQEIDISTAGNYYLVFYWCTDGSWQGNDGSHPDQNPPAAVDDISVTKVACGVPTALTCTATATNSATIGWTSGGSESQWKVRYKKTTETTWQETTTNSNPHTLSNLTPNTSYEVQVKAVCGGANGESDYSESLNFRTDCAPQTIPYIEDFEYEIASSSCPYCWERIIAYNSYPYVTSSGGHDADKCLYMGHYSSYPQNVIALPEMAVPINTLQISLWVRASSTVPEEFQVGYIKNGAFYSLKSFTLSTTYQQFHAYLNQAPSDAEKIAIRSYHASSYCYVYVDDINVTALPSCLVPENLHVAHSPSSIAATLAWTETGSATSWTLEYGTSSDFSGASSVEVSGTPSADLSHLTPETTYYARVRAKCGGSNGNSEWSETLEFTPSTCHVFGTGTANSYYVPVNMFYNYSFSQMIYTADDIGAGEGKITSIAFKYDYTSSFSMDGIKVYMLNTDKESFASNTDLVSVSDDNKVFEGTFSATEAGWTTITLQTPFEYSGGNLLVCIYDPTSGYPGSSYKFSYTGTSAYRSLSFYSDSSDPTATPSSSYSGSKSYNKYVPNAMFCIDRTYKAEIVSVEYGSSNWCIGDARDVTLRIKNTGTATWYANGNATTTQTDHDLVAVSYHWNEDYNRYGNVSYDEHNNRNHFTSDVAPGETATISFNVVGPRQSGSNQLKFSLIRQECCWFYNQNNCSSAPEKVISVTVPSPTLSANPTAVCPGGSATLTAGCNATGDFYAYEPYIWDWNSSDYTGSDQITNATVNGSLLTFTTNGGDPKINMYDIGHFDPSIYKTFKMRYRYVGSNNNVEIFHTYADRPTAIDQTQSHTGAIIGDGQWHIVEINMTAGSYGGAIWNSHGDILGWRLDPCGLNGVTMQIDWVGLFPDPIATNVNNKVVTPTQTTTYYMCDYKTNRPYIHKVSSTVNLSPIPDLTISSTPPTTTCIAPGTAMTLTPTCTNTTLSSYNWAVNSGTSGTANSNGTYSVTPTAASNSYTVTATSNMGCSATASREITTKPVVNSFTASTGTMQDGKLHLCSSTSVNLTASVNGAITSYEWRQGSTTGTQLSSTTNVLTVTPGNGSTTYYVKAKNSSCESDWKSITVNVLNLSTDITASSTAECINSGTTITLTASSSNASVSTTPSISYNWSNGISNNSQISFTPNDGASNTYTVSCIAATPYNCTATKTFTRSYSHNPTVSISPSSTTVDCTSDIATLTASGNATNYTWSNGNTGTTANVTITAAAGESQDVTVTAYKGNCTKTAEATVSVHAFNAGSISSETYTVCSNDTRSFTIGNSNEGTSSGTARYQWRRVSNGATTTLSHNSATYSFSLSDIDNLLANNATQQQFTFYRDRWNPCTEQYVPSSGSFTLTVNATPAPPTVPGSDICVGNTTTLYVTSPNSNYTYTWYDNGGNPVTLPTGTPGLIENVNGQVNEYSPFDAYYEDGWTESIYHADELNMPSGDITSVAFYIASVEDNDDWDPIELKIYMANSTKTAFESETDWTAASELTLVYSGAPTITSANTGWYTFNLSPSFHYNGQNLVVAVSHKADEYVDVRLRYSVVNNNEYRFMYRNEDGDYSYGEHPGGEEASDWEPWLFDIKLTNSTTASAGTYYITPATSENTTYQVTATATYGTLQCVSEPTEVTVTVHSNPVVSEITPSPATICPGGTSTLSVTSNATNYTWSSPDGCTQSGQHDQPGSGSSVTVNYPGGQTAYSTDYITTVTAGITYDGENNSVTCSAKQNVTVTVKGFNPGSIKNASVALCEGAADPINIADNVDGNSYGAARYAWCRVPNADTDDFYAAGNDFITETTTANVTLTAAQRGDLSAGTYYFRRFRYDDCTDRWVVSSGVLTLTVGAVPAAPQISAEPVCDGSTSTLTAEPVANCTYQWYDPTGQLLNSYVAIENENGTSSHNPSVFANYFKNGWTESIYHADELNLPATDIASVSFYLTGSSTWPLGEMRIFMANSDKAAFAGNTDWTGMDDLTLVYSGTPVFSSSSTGWFTFPLNTPFPYDGTSNLVVVVAHTGTDYTSSIKTRYTEVSENRFLYRNSDSNTGYGQHPGTNTGTLKRSLYDVKLATSVLSYTTPELHTGGDNTYSVTASVSYGSMQCTSAPTEIEVPVHAHPVVSEISREQTEVCPSGSATVSVTSDATAYTWSASDGCTTSGQHDQPGSGSSVTVNYPGGQTAYSTDYTITVTASIAYEGVTCSTEQTGTFDVRGFNAGTIVSGSATQCANADESFSITSDDAGYGTGTADFAWYRVPSPTTSNIADGVLVKTTDTASTTTVSASERGSLSAGETTTDYYFRRFRLDPCTHQWVASSGVFTLTVGRVPDAPTVPPTHTCDGNSATITIAGPNADYTYTWYDGNGDPVIVTNGLENESSTKSSYYLFTNYYNNGWSEMIYRADELGLTSNSREIYSVSFYIMPSSSSFAWQQDEFKIYMANSAKTEFTSTSDWTAASDLTLVYSGSPRITDLTTGWYTFNLTTPFTYDGSSNLVIAVSHKKGSNGTSYTTNLKNRYTSTSDYRVLYRNDDGDASYGDHPGTNTGTRLNYHYDVRLAVLSEYTSDYYITPELSSNGNYSYQATATATYGDVQCVSNPALVKVPVFNNPVINSVTANQEYRTCTGTPITLTAHTTPGSDADTDGWTYSWTALPGSGTSHSTGSYDTCVMTPTIGGAYSYSATVTDQNGCMATGTLSDETPVIAFGSVSITSSPSSAVNAGTGVTLTAQPYSNTVSSDVSVCTYAWNSTVTTGSMTTSGNVCNDYVVSTSTYTVTATVTSANHCTVTGSKTVNVKPNTGGNNSCETAIIYCHYSTSYGDDANDGSSSAPVNTLARALDLAASHTDRTASNPAIIRMAGSSTDNSDYYYNIDEPVQLVSNVVVDGGWYYNANTGVWTKNNSYVTTINRTDVGIEGDQDAPRIVAIEGSGKTGFKLQDVTVKTDNAPAPISEPVTGTAGQGSGYSTTIPTSGTTIYPEAVTTGFKVYDNSQFTGYSSSWNGYLVLKPANGGILSVSGTVNVEGGYDYISVYSCDENGNNQEGVFTRLHGSGTSIQTFAIGPYTSTNASGCLKILFHSDGSNQGSGANLTITEMGTAPGVSTYAVHLSDCSGYELVRCNLQPGNASAGTRGLKGANGGDGSAGSSGSAGNGSAGTNAPSGSNSVESGGSGGSGASSYSTGGNGGTGGNSGYSSGSNVYNGASGSSGVAGTGGSGGSYGTAHSSIKSGGTDERQPSYTGLTGNSGNPGGNGSTGSTGSTYEIGYNNYTAYFMPQAGGQGGAGTGGGGGGGGGGGQSVLARDYRAILNANDCWAIATGGSGGGGGGGGGGGQGGFGGAGGGASFGIYSSSSTNTTNNTTVNLDNILINSYITVGTAGAGGAGGSGGAGGTGGNGGTGGGTTTKSQSKTVGSLGYSATATSGAGGAGGNGGNGGAGGTGGAGAAGISYEVVVADRQGALDFRTDSYGPAPSNPVPITTIDYGNTSKQGCTKSQIAITKGNNDEWNDVGTLIQDLGPTSSSYETLPLPNSIVSSYGIGTHTPVTNGSQIFITENRELGSIMGAQYTCPSGIEVYSYTGEINEGDVLYWKLFHNNAEVPNSSYGAAYSDDHDTKYTVNFDTLGITEEGVYYVRLEVDNKCCGRSIPIWYEVNVKFPGELEMIDTVDIVCGDTITLHVTPLNNDYTYYDWYLDDGTGQPGNYIYTGLTLPPQDSITYSADYFVYSRIGSDSSRCRSSVAQPAHITITMIGETTNFITPDTITIFCGTGIDLTAADCQPNAPGRDVAYRWYSDREGTEVIGRGPHYSVDNLVEGTILYVQAHSVQYASDDFGCHSYIDSVRIQLRSIPGPISVNAYNDYFEPVNEICKGDYLHFIDDGEQTYYDRYVTDSLENDELYLAWFLGDPNVPHVPTDAALIDYIHSYYYQSAEDWEYYGAEPGTYTYYAHVISDILSMSHYDALTPIYEEHTDIPGFTGVAFNLRTNNRQITLDTVTIRPMNIASGSNYHLRVLWRPEAFDNSFLSTNTSGWMVACDTTLSLPDGFNSDVMLRIQNPVDIPARSTYSLYITTLDNFQFEGYLNPNEQTARGDYLTLTTGAGVQIMNGSGFPVASNVLPNGQYCGTVRYHISGSLQYGCISEAYDSITIIVDTPFVAPTHIMATPDTIVCQGTDVTLTANGMLGSNSWYEWFKDGVRVANAPGNAIVDAPEHTALYKVRIDGEFCHCDTCAPAVRSVYVNETPIVKIGDSILCHLDNLNDIPHSVVYIGPADRADSCWERLNSDNQWVRIPDDTVLHVPYALNGAVIRYSATLRDCPDFKGSSDPITLKVDSLPEISPIINPDPICQGTSLTLSGMVPAVDFHTCRPQFNQEQWMASLNGGEAVVVNDNTTFTHEQSPVIFYQATNFCDVSRSNQVSLRVVRTPVVEDIVMSPTEVCEYEGLPAVNLEPNYEADFKNQGAVSDIVSTLWMESETLEGPYATFRLDSLGYERNYHYFAYFVTNGCGTDTSNVVQVRVKAIPVVAAPSLSDTILCKDDTIFVETPTVTDRGNGILESGWVRISPTDTVPVTLPTIVNYAEWNGTYLKYIARNECGIGWSDPVYIGVYPEHHLSISTPEGKFICPKTDFSVEAVSDLNSRFVWEFDRYTGLDMNDTVRESLLCDWRYVTTGDHTFTVTASPVGYEFNCRETVSVTIRVYEQPLRVHTRGGLCSADATFYYEVNDSIYREPTVDTVSVHFADNDACDSITYFLTVTDGTPFIQLDDNELEAGVGQTMSTGFLFGSDCPDDPQKISLAYQLYKDGVPVDRVEQYGSLNITTTLPRQNIDFSSDLTYGRGEIPSDVFNIQYYDYDYFYSNFAASITNSVTGVWNEDGEYKVVFSLYRRAAGQDFPMTYQASDNVDPVVIGGTGSRLESLITTDSVVMIVGVPQIILDTAVLVATYLGELDIDTTSVFNEEVNGVTTFDVSVNSLGGNAPTKLSIEYVIKRNGVTLDNLAPYGKIDFSTTVPRLQRSFGRTLTNGTGSIPDETFAILYYEYDYFYNHFFETAPNQLTTMWYQPGVYEITFTLMERVNGQDIPISYDNAAGLLIGGHGSNSNVAVDTKTLVFRVTADTVTIDLDESVCEGDLPFEYNGHQFWTSGEYPFSDEIGLFDTIIRLNLTINTPVAESFDVTECGSYLWNDTVRTVSGTYYDIHADANGCTQVDTLYLTILQPADSAISATACGSYRWNDSVYTVSGDYTQTFPATNGCDSTVTLHLTVNYPVATESTVTACGSYMWNDTVRTESGDYTQILTAANGCDSVVTLHLTINTPVAESFEVTECSSYEWNDTVRTVSGTYYDIHEDANGCTQVDTLYLTILQPAVSDISATACGSYRWNDSVYTVSGDYTQTFPAVNGCDSTVTLHLTVNYPVATESTVTACVSYMWNDTVRTESGDYTQILTAANGCDSVVTLHLTINTPVAEASTVTACGSYEWNGTVHTESGTYYNTHEDANGCTQVDTLYLTINSTYNDTVRETKNIYEMPYTWNGMVFTGSDTLTAYLESVSGCDSTVTMVLTVTGVTGDDPLMTVRMNEAGDTATVIAFANQTPLTDKISINYHLYKGNNLVENMTRECGGTLYIGTELNGRYYGTELSEAEGNVPGNTFHIANNYYDYFYWGFLDGRANAVTHSFTDTGTYKVVFELVEESAGQDFTLAYDDDITHRIGGKNSVAQGVIGQPVEVTFRVTASTSGGDTPQTVDGPKIVLPEIANGSVPDTMTFLANGYGNERVAIRYRIYRGNDETPLPLLSSVGSVRIATAFNGTTYGDNLTASTGYIPEATFHPVSRYYNYFYMHFLDYSETYNLITANWTAAGEYRIEFDLVRMTGGQDFTLVYGNNYQKVGGKNAQFANVIYDTKTLRYTNGTTAQNPVATGIADNDGDSDGFVLYPNPTRDRAVLTLGRVSEGAFIVVADVNGKEVHRAEANGSRVEFSVAKWSEGVYFVTLHDKDQIVTKKLVVTK